MKRSCIMLLTLVALGTGPVRAAPPTVTPSPGYDARLQEQRAAASSRSAEPARKPVTHRHHKRGRAY
ncbi:hypothetical protein ACVIGB_005912 [Bradyrhizobium sp. USDA 4341]|jgi:hypothetical protein|uniref:Uncharacterized protein n=1 Tax=Bradyrhizobium erythrophlei TaxID=1437360 RepID=A0A1H5ARD5_9BRAD|nr:hypothetical protein [Bradyrhizobium erythrophlei]SED44371.1 hypothetical protein SAMN05444164_4764 [Bradyrhizobium erythrophlei]